METLKTRPVLPKGGEHFYEEMMIVEQIPSELEGIRYAFSLIQETRNVLCSPIFALPDETLMDILRYCAWQAEPRSKTYMLERLVFTFVCRRWRSIAIEAPLCWTDVRHVSRRCITTFLQRAKAAPISAISTGRLDDNILIHLSHTECLELVHTSPRRSDHANPPFPGLVGKLAPMLKCLSAAHGGKPFPSEFLLSAPLLRELEMSGFALDWSSIHWETLHRLDMTRTTTRQHFPLDTLVHLLEGLRKAEQLQTLALREYIPPPDLPTIVNTSPIRLESLRKLELSGDASACMPLVCLLRIPPRTTLKLSLWGSTQHMKRSFVASLEHTFKKETVRSRPLVSLNFDGGWTNNRLVSLRLSTRNGSSPFRVRTLRPDGIRTEGGSPAITVDFANTELSPDFTTSLLNAFPFDHLVSASINIWDRNVEYDHYPVWAAFLRSATKLTHLYLSGSPVYGFLQALCHPSQVGLSNGPVDGSALEPMLPALCDLLLGRFDKQVTSLEAPWHVVLPGCIARLPGPARPAKLKSIWLLDVRYEPEWVDPLRPHAEEVLIPCCHRGDT